MKCPKCGETIPESSEYCPECGAKLIASKTVEAGKTSEFTNKKTLMIIGSAIILGIIIVIVLVLVREPPKYPEDFVLRYDEVPSKLTYSDFTCGSYSEDDKESCLRDLKEAGVYGLSNPGYLQASMYNWFTSGTVDESGISSMYFTLFDEKGYIGTNLWYIVLNYKSEQDLELDLSRVYSDWRGEILQYKNLLVLIGSDSYLDEETIEISKNLRKRLPLKVIKTREETSEE